MSTLWCPFKSFKSDVLEAERTVQKIVFASRFSENSIVRNAGFLDEGSNNQVLIIFFLSIFEYTCNINFFTFYHFWNVFKNFSFKKIKKSRFDICCESSIKAINCKWINFEFTDLHVYRLECLFNLQRITNLKLPKPGFPGIFFWMKLYNNQKKIGVISEFKTL